MKKILEAILDNNSFNNKPIVLLHVGSNGSEFVNWNKISKSSILVAVDPEKQSFNLGNFKKIIKVSNIISDRKGLTKFNVTKNTDCSSLLIPNSKVYSSWLIANRFRIKKRLKVKTVTINGLLKKNDLNYIDWLVLDTQGMDLRILKSISKKIFKNISIVDVEPSYFEFYKNEGTLVDIINFLNKQFDFKDISFGKNFKVRNEQLTYFDKLILKKFNKPSKIYSNLIYINKRQNEERKVMMKLIYLILNQQFYEAKSILDKNSKISNRKVVIKNLNKKIIYYKFIFILLLPYFMIKKFFLNSIVFLFKKFV
tara:strand:- start:8747 stop:9679 length:933 start_codon:yes stop_codon:yes gene_type:complete